MVKDRNSFYILTLIILLSIIIRLPALIRPHNENDEIIYQTLALQALQHHAQYSLQETSILKNLPHQIYDHSLFHHPPFFIFCLALITYFFGQNWMIMVSVISGVLTILLTYDICRRLYSSKKALISAFITFCCPLLLFCAMRIWIDALLAFLVTLTVWTFMLAVRNNQKPYFVLSGIIFGLCLLTKQPGLFTVFTFLFLLFKDGISKQKMIYLVYFLSAAILTCSPWYIYFYNIYGTLFPSWAKPSMGSIKTFSFIGMIVHRPWHFYVTHLILIAPIYLFGFISILIALKKKFINAELIWALSFLIPLTILGINGWGFQTRYVVPAIPALAILSAYAFETENRWVRSVGILFLGLGLFTGILNSLVFIPDDVAPFFYIFNK